MRLAILSALASLGLTGGTAQAQYYGPRPQPTVSFGFSYNTGYGGYSFGYNTGYYAPRPVYAPPVCNHGHYRPYPPVYVAPYPGYNPYPRPYWR